MNLNMFMIKKFYSEEDSDSESDSSSSFLVRVFFLAFFLLGLMASVREFKESQIFSWTLLLNSWVSFKVVTTSLWVTLVSEKLL